MKGVGLGFVGFAFGCAAAWFLYVGLTLDITAPGSQSAGAGFSQGVASLQLMHIQLLDVVTGIGAAIVSAIFFIGGAIVQALTEALAEWRSPE